MFVGKRLYVELTKEEKETLTKAKEILMDFENFSTSEQEEDLQAVYDHYIDYRDHDYALPTAIDFLGAILEVGEVDNEV